MNESGWTEWAASRRSMERTERTSECRLRAAVAAGARGFLASATGLLVLLLTIAPAQAHKVTIFAAAQGERIEGQVSLQGGAPAPDTRVTVYDGAGQTVTRLVTDKEGRFHYQPRYRSDYRLVASAGFGHKAETTIPASALPADLPQVDPQPADGDGKSESPPSLQEDPPAGATIPRDEVVRELRALREQTSALRMDLDRWRQHLRVQDILGGVGYIVGIAGLGFFLLGYRRKHK